MWHPWKRRQRYGVRMAVYAKVRCKKWLLKKKVDENGLRSALDYNEVVIQHDSVQEPCRGEYEVEGTATAFTPFDMLGQDNVGGGVSEQEGNSGQGNSTIRKFDMGISEAPSLV